VNRNSWLRRGVFVFIAFLAFGTIAMAQDTASLRGTVTDESGGVIIGAKVTLTNTKTNVSRTASTGNDGGYVFTAVQVGTYQLSATHPNFQTVLQKGIALDLNQNGRVDVVLKVGQSATTVEVNTTVAQVDTASAVLGKVEDERAIRDLPLLDRDTLQLGLLQAGVFAPDPDDTSGNPFSVSGQRSESLTFLLDGANNTDFLGNNIVVSPNPDAVEEFKILTNNYDAEYGRTSGGIVNQITKSGTNDFHGDLFEFIRNDALNARDDFANQRSPFKRNVFGGTIGGPIKKDKAFFFFAYQGARRREGQVPQEIAVPDQAERGGNFAELCSAYDGSGNCTASALAAGGTQLINPYTGGNIPYNNMATAGLVNPIMQNYINKYLPLPNLPGNNFEASPSALVDDDQGIVHLDYNLTSHDVFSFVYLIDDSRDFFPEEGGAISSLTGAEPIGSGNAGNVPVGSGGTDGQRNQIGTFTWSHTFSGGKLNEFRFGVSRFKQLSSFPTDSTSPSALGFTNITPADPKAPAPPTIFTPTFALGPSVQGPTTLNRTNWEWSDTFTVPHGRHEIMFGVDITRIQNNFYYDYYNNGGFDFDEYAASFTGNDFADFVGGFYDNFEQSDYATYGIRTGSYSGFVQDTWKVLPRLTLNYGLRYEFYVPQYDVHNNILGYFPGEQSTVFPNAPPDILYPGDPGTPNRALMYPDYKNFAPRFGFAWDMFGNAKLVMRGGFGLFYDLQDGATNLQFGGEPPFGYIANNYPSSYQGITTDPVADPYTPFGLTNPFPYTNLTFLTPKIPYAYVTDPHFRTPYSENFNYGFQWQAAKKTMLEAVYVGSLGRRLISTGETNFPQPSILQYQLQTYYASATAAGVSPINPDCARLLAACTGGFLNPSDPYDPSGSPTAETQIFTNLGNGLSDSHQFQFTADHQYSHGLQFRVAYTVAKTIDLTSGYRARSFQYTDPLDDRLDRSVADFDTPQRLVISEIWNIPFDAAIHREGFVKKIAGGWQLNAIASFQKGNPLTFYSDSNQSFQNNGLDRVDVTGPIAYVNPRQQNSFSTDCNGGNTQASHNFWINSTNMLCSPCPLNDPTCSQAGDVGIPLFTYGNLGRNKLRGPGINNWDISVTKTTQITEHKQIEFRAEFFNAFNHTQFFRVDYDGGSPTFGQVLNDRGPRLIQFGLKFYF
jgi:outer membrane receptor protein involved in Fe transport